MAYRQSVKARNTLIKIAYQESVYVSGEGTQTIFKKLCVPVGFDDDGEELFTDCFYCEWLNSYGSMAVLQQQDNINQPARLRMTFIDKVYQILQTKNVKIYKFGQEDEANTFILNSAVDCYLEQRKMMEFQVKRSDSK